MAITTLDGALAGMQPPRMLNKANVAGVLMVSSHLRGLSTWYMAGAPGAASANAAGAAGEAVTYSTSSGSPIPRSNPGAGVNAYLARLGLANSTGGGGVWLVDRLWHNSGLSATLTSAQTVNSVALPARDLDGATAGKGVFAAVEWSAASTSGSVNLTLTYTNSAGTAGRTATITGTTASPTAGTMEIFPLQAGDLGIQSIQSFQQSGTRTGGTFHLVLFRVLAMQELPAAGGAFGQDPLTSAFPRIFDNSALQLIGFSTSTSTISYLGIYAETHG